MHRYLMAILFLLVLSPSVWAQKDYSLSISPATQTINAGRQTTFTVTAQPINGFKKPISLVVMANPASSDVTVSLSSTVISPGASTTVTVSASPLANAQTVSVSITGTAKNKVRSTQGSVSINVPQFNLAVNPPTATAQQGDALNFTISSQGETDFARDISLNVATSPAFAFQLTKMVLAPPNDSATLRIDTTSLPPGSYIANISATAGAIQRTTPISFTVIARPSVGKSDLRVLLPSVTLRADDVGHLVVTGLVQNFGNGDASFVKLNFKVFNQNNFLLETGSTFINGFSGVTTTGVATNTTVPRGKIASFQKVFNISFVSMTQRVEFAFDFMEDTVTAPKANLVVDSLTRVINNLGGSNYSVVVRNTGTVAARSPQVIIDSFDRANQIFDVIIAGSGSPNDVIQPGQTVTLTATNPLPFDLTRVNDQHAIWFDLGAITITESLEGLTGLELEKKRNELVEMQIMAHKLLLAR